MLWTVWEGGNLGSILPPHASPQLGGFRAIRPFLGLSRPRLLPDMQVTRNISDKMNIQFWHAITNLSIKSEYYDFVKERDVHGNSVSKFYKV